MNVKSTQISWMKKLAACMTMLFVSLFLAVMNTKTVNAETLNCDVYYDAVKKAVRTGNAETGNRFQLDADLCEIAKQIAVNASSELSYYHLAYDSWIEALVEKNGKFKSCEYGGRGFRTSADEIEARDEIVQAIKACIEYDEEYYKDYNLIGAAIVSNRASDWEDGSQVYYYVLVHGKGICKPYTNTGTQKEMLATGDTVKFTNNSANNSSNGSVSNTAAKVTSVKINADSKTLLTGKKMTLTAGVLPANAANKNLTWSVSNKKYATINQNGELKAKAAGAGKTITVTVKAQDGSGKKATYKIKIKGSVSKITLKAQKSVKAGKKVTIKPTVKIGKGGSKALKWTSSNNSWATVNAKGVVTTKKAGKGQKVKITATAKDGSGKKASVTIKLK